MITEHGCFKPAAIRSSLVRRYMPLEKFEWMLQRKALYFCRAEFFDDKREGFFTEASAGGRDATINKWLPMTESRKHPIGNDLANTTVQLILDDNTRAAREQMYVNCWHMNDDESGEMWASYAGGQSGGVCVKTSYQTLTDELPRECYLGCVEYIDRSREQVDPINAFNFIMRSKGLEYADEREVRSVIRMAKIAPLRLELLDDKGLVVPVDLNRLVEEVVVSPNSAPGLLERVKELTRLHAVQVPVTLSVLKRDSPSSSA
jgi:hypothetical protein